MGANRLTLSGLLGLGCTTAPGLGGGIGGGRPQRLLRLLVFLLLAIFALRVAADVLLDVAVAERLDHHLDNQEAPVNVKHEQQAQETEPDEPDPVPHAGADAVETAGLGDRRDDVSVRKGVGTVQDVAEENVGHGLPLQVHEHLSCNRGNTMESKQSVVRTCLEQQVVDVVDHEHTQADLGEVDVVREEHERDGGEVVHEHLGVVLALDRVVLVGDVEHEVDALEPEAQVDHVVPALQLAGHVRELGEVRLLVHEPRLMPADVEAKHVERAHRRVLVERLAHLVLLVLGQPVLAQHVAHGRADEGRVHHEVVRVQAGHGEAEALGLCHGVALGQEARHATVLRGGRQVTSADCVRRVDFRTEPTHPPPPIDHLCSAHSRRSQSAVSTESSWIFGTWLARVAVVRPIIPTALPACAAAGPGGPESCFRPG
ncbi:hypothetical protein ON010_g10514 [Phytophthora cinnamomi]|nr:hypothetical protein ON010_g10514 [Phytophthora cinnamomi]